MGLRLCISQKLPGEADAAVSQTTQSDSSPKSKYALVGGFHKELLRENTTTASLAILPLALSRLGARTMLLSALLVAWGPTDALRRRAVFAHLQHAARKLHAFPAFLIFC